MKIYIKLCSLATYGWVVAVLFSSIFFTSTTWGSSSDTEIRAIWMHPEEQFDPDPEKGKAAVYEFVDRMADANFNLILPWITSEYLAALTDRKYQRSIPIAEWDALGVLVEAAQKRGLQVHLWYSFTYYKSPNSPEFNPAHGGDPNWASISISEVESEREGRHFSGKRMQNLCPMHPGGRKWELSLIEKALKRYPMLSGVHIEEPGYSGPGHCACDLCSRCMREIFGPQALPGVNGPQAEDLKCLGTTEFMRQLHSRVAEADKKRQLSTNGGYSWQHDRASGRDWKRWAELKWLDFYAAQIYTDNTKTFQERAFVTVNDLSKNCPVAVGIRIRFKHGTNPIDTVLNQVQIARKLGAKGVVFYHGKTLTDDYLSALRKEPFSQPAALPWR